MATIKEKVAEMEAGVSAQAERIAKLEAGGDASAMLAEIRGEIEHLKQAMLGIAKVIPEAMLSKPVPLRPDEIALILRDNPGARFKVLAASPRLKLRQNEVFVAQHRFDTAKLCSYVEGGNLQVLAA